MEKKKSTVATVLLLIAVLIIGAMAGYIYMQKTESEKRIGELETQKTEMQSQIDNLQGKIDTISNTINEEDENRKQEIIDILKNINKSLDEYGEIEYFNVLKINNDNKQYTIEVEYNTPIVISENEFNNLKRNKEIILNNEKYEYVIDNDSANGYIQKSNKKYEIIEYKDGYVFILSGTAGGYIWTINKTENMKFVADEDTVIYDSFIGKGYKLKDDKAKDWLNKSLENTIIRLRYSEDSGISIYIDNK